MIFLSTILFSVLVTMVLIPPLGKLAVRLQLLDLPDERKIHVLPVPRCGGLAMALGALPPLLWWYRDSAFMVAYLAGSLVIIIFGLLDDFWNLSPRWKLVGQVAAALIVIFGGGVEIITLGSLWPESVLFPAWIGIPLTVIAIVGVTNAINLADGLDGLAGGISLLVLAGIGFLAYLANNHEVGLACLALCGAVFGFLRYNTHPATIFMGDTGSQLLGYSAIVLSFHLTQGGTAYSPLLPLIILGFPVLDTVTVMIGRLRERRSPFSPDRKHFHHTLLTLGLFHAESVQVIYVIQAGLVMLAYLLRYQSEWLILGLYLLFSLMIIMVFNRAARLKRPPTRHPLLIRFKRAMRDVRRDRRLLIFSYRTHRMLFSLLLLSICLIPQKLPVPMVIVAVIVAVALPVMVRFQPLVVSRLLPPLLYFVIPCLIYWTDLDVSRFLTPAGARVYLAVFILLALTGIVVSLLSTRTGGFKSTPLDFLILFLVVVVPNLPSQSEQAHILGVVGMKIVILYYSCELLLGEQRGKNARLALTTALAAAVLVVNHLVG